MKVICLCKRRPQGRDLVTQPFGRFYHLPRLLAERGHEVHLLLLGYRHEPAIRRDEGNLHIHAVSSVPLGPFAYLASASNLAAELKPDWVLGYSDTWFGIFAERLARKYGARCLIDAYDNYESYIPWFGLLHRRWRSALARADAVTAAGPQLAALMSASAGGRSVDVLPMAADPLFAPLDKWECRRRLGLPEDGLLVGYAGALHPNRDIDFLFRMFARLQAALPDLGLVVSGRLASGVKLPANIHWLGYRPPDQVPSIINSLDLLFAINRPGAFGDFSYPVKLYEAMACGVPVLASAVPGSAWVLRDRPESLAKTGDIDDFVSKAQHLLDSGIRPLPCRMGWPTVADSLEALLLRRV